LRAEEIAPGAKILAVVDIFDALTAPRPYREPETPQGALEILRQEARRGRLDGEVVEALAGIMDRILQVKEGIDRWIQERGIRVGQRAWLREGEMRA
jgi:HD-GYP domain-containing protein (c-di-GMP phosphodiesterase class II)